MFSIDFLFLRKRLDFFLELKKEEDQIKAAQEQENNAQKITFTFHVGCFFIS